MTYYQQLKDPRWQRTRLEIMQRDDFTCQQCGSKDQTLHVHHKHYTYGNAPWDYKPEVLITLCMDCHQSEEYGKAAFKEVYTGLLESGYTYGQLTQMLAGLQIPIPVSNDERVQYGSYAASDPELLQNAKDKSMRGWKQFFDEADQNQKQQP
jgi:hypothetical protein